MFSQYDHVTQRLGGTGGQTFERGPRPAVPLCPPLIRYTEYTPTLNATTDSVKE